ncbi:MAG: preprotein translocase subunit SecE [Candidatus Gracilibacteria bacterium]|nr:preprotein translocase subunit SecE [Candidatus Gracilibacteria bacterium]
MISFLKDSFREIKHVVWPTKDDTRKYFFIVVGVLVTFGLYIFVASTLFTNIIFALKDLIK